MWNGYPIVCYVTTQPGGGVITDFVYHCVSRYQVAHFFLVAAVAFGVCVLLAAVSRR
jgi:hypothetical protein